MVEKTTVSSFLLWQARVHFDADCL